MKLLSLGLEFSRLLFPLRIRMRWSTSYRGLASALESRISCDDDIPALAPLALWAGRQRRVFCRETAV